MKKVLLAFLFVSLGCCGLFAVKAVSDITDELYNIRSVYSEKIAVESVTLSPSAVTMNVGESVAMTAKINPAGAVAELEWVSSDPLVASVMSDGTVVANGPGVCEITVSALDESLFTASCMVNVTEPSGAACMTFVDMGTSVLWGSQPLGVDAGHPYGQLYRPGAVDPVPSGKSYFSGWGVEDNEWGGNSKIDAATALYGSGVKVPSRDEFQELLDNCELISHSRDYTIGRNVLTLKSKTTGNTLVLVGAGYYDVAGDNSSKPDIYFWVSTAVAGSNIDNYYFSAEAAQSKGMDKAIMLSKIYATTYAYQILPVFKAQDIVKASGVAINTDKCDMAVKDKLSLSVTVTPENTSNPALRWFSSDESVATVNGHGEVTAISAGECEITALTTDGSELSVSCLITVIEAT
ncbi:MAG: Ig-like domain-containing protein, partial [Muribaculaceae bacterium]|nr:Ig-like domain-containing protein [Muribaculaceae bacterium]